MAENQATAPTLLSEPSTRSTESPVLFFDGVCGLCNRFVDFVLKHDRQTRIRFATLQGETAVRLLPPEDCETLSSMVFRHGERNYRRSSGVVQLLWQLPFIWKVLAALLWLIPLPLRNIGYRLVASQRYRVFGRRDTCRLPTEHERSRFLP